MDEKIRWAANKLAITTRGVILHDMAAIEGLISGVLTIHFCGDNEEKAEQFLHIVLGNKNVSFFAKLSMLNGVLKMYYPSFLTKNPKFLKDMDNMVEVRNRFAHYQFYPNESGELFLEFSTMISNSEKTALKLDIKKEVLSSEKNNEYLNKINSLNKALTELLSDLMKTIIPKK